MLSCFYVLLCLYRVTWSFNDSNGNEKVLSEGFYPARESKELFEGSNPHYAVVYDEGENGVIFYISVKGADKNIKS